MIMTSDRVLPGRSKPSCEKNRDSAAGRSSVAAPWQRESAALCPIAWRVARTFRRRAPCRRQRATGPARTDLAVWPARLPCSMVPAPVWAQQAVAQVLPAFQDDASPCDPAATFGRHCFARTRWGKSPAAQVSPRSPGHRSGCRCCSFRSSPEDHFAAAEKLSTRRRLGVNRDLDSWAGRHSVPAC
jgi:hypothetical protein